MKVLNNQMKRLRQIAGEMDPIRADMQRLRQEDEALLQQAETKPADVRRAGEIALLLNIHVRKLGQLQVEQDSIDQILPSGLKKASRDFQKILRDRRQKVLDRAVDKLTDIEPDREKLRRALEQGNLAGLRDLERDIAHAGIPDGIGREAGESWLGDAERFIEQVVKITAKRGFVWP